MCVGDCRRDRALGLRRSLEARLEGRISGDPVSRRDLCGHLSLSPLPQPRTQLWHQVSPGSGGPGQGDPPGSGSRASPASGHALGALPFLFHLELAPVVRGSGKRPGALGREGPDRMGG